MRSVRGSAGFRTSKGRSGRSWRAARKRAVSDVVATILLLALTVTLFSAIFAFVTTFPPPPAQNNNQFSASLVFPSNGSTTYVAGITILHLTGPAVPGNGQIYLKSSVQPTAPEFLTTYTVSSGLHGSNLWNLGQTWNLTFPITTMPLARGNITIYIVSDYQLLFSVILPGTAFSTPPTVVATSVSPSNPGVGVGFTVFATLAGNYKTNSVFVNLASIPGAPTTAQKMTQNGQGQWTYLLAAGLTTTPGTYYGFVNASGPTGSGQTAVGAVVITIGNPNGGGGTITVGVVAIPQPPTVTVSTDYFAAVITYTGSATNAPLNVSFWVNQSSRAPFPTHVPTSTELTGPAQPLTISGPSTVTVYGVWPKGGAFSSWLLNSSVWVNASATISGVGTASGTDPLATPNYAQGLVFPTIWSVSSTCRTAGTSCPSLDVSVWNNWTTALGGPAQLTFAGNVWANSSTTHSGPYAVSYTVNQGASSLSQVAKSAFQGTVKTTYTLTVLLIVTNTATGAVVGYIYDTSLMVVN